MSPPPHLSGASDQEVVAWARQGREEGYRELLRRYQRPVYSLIYRMVGDRELAEDLAQETFVKAFNALDSYRSEFKSSSWIFKIANNATIDHLRRKQLDTLSLEGSPYATTPGKIKATAIQVADRSDSTPAKADTRELGSAMERAIGRLRGKYRRCIILRHIEQRSYENIAEIPDLPRRTVKTYMHRARNELKDALGPLRSRAKRARSHRAVCRRECMCFLQLSLGVARPRRCLEAQVIDWRWTLREALHSVSTTPGMVPTVAPRAAWPGGVR